MGLIEWLKGFRVLHEAAKNGTLSADELVHYRSACDELARALLVAQRCGVRPGQQPCRALRMARALQLDLDFPDGAERAMTTEVSAEGFEALLSSPPRAGKEVRFSLRIPGGDPMRGSARVAEVRQQPGNVRASFAYVGIGAAEVDRLQQFVFDAVLAQLKI